MNWVMTYRDVLTEVPSEDRVHAVKVIDNDAEFDRWLNQYIRKQNNTTSSKARGVPVSKEEFFKGTKGRLPNPSKKD